MAKKAAKIKEIRDMMGQVRESAIEKVKITPLKELAQEFSTIPDRRFQPYVEHKLSDIVMITLLAVMSEADEWIEIGIFAKKKEGWLRSFLELSGGIPSHDTIQRVMSQITGSLLYSLT
ncbi:MAG: transposase family protein, partial [Spirochaetaceae bacterium]|nr:transposase family protein [Spirochaetaceae bacterium]